MLYDPSFTYPLIKINLGSGWFQSLAGSSTIKDQKIKGLINIEGGDVNNLSILKITLRIFGVAFILIMPMMKLDPLGGWAWSPGQWEYEMMIQGVYMTLGIMMLIAANDPLKNPLFVWFVVWSSLVHGGIMAYQAIIDTHEMGHFLGDIPALFILAIIAGYNLRKLQTSS